MARIGSVDKGYWVTSQVAAAVGIPVSTLRNWTTARKCPLPPDDVGYLHFGRKWYPEHVRALAEWMDKSGILRHVKKGNHRMEFRMTCASGEKTLEVLASKEDLLSLRPALDRAIVSGEGRSGNVKFVNVNRKGKKE